MTYEQKRPVSAAATVANKPLPILSPKPGGGSLLATKEITRPGKVTETGISWFTQVTRGADPVLRLRSLQ